MGFTSDQSTNEKDLLCRKAAKSQNDENKSKKSDFYSFLQELNYKTELGLE